MEKMLQAYIITGPPAPALARAREMAAEALCGAAGERPCRVCRNCRKVFAGIHPDVALVERLPDSKGRLRREIVVDQIRDLSGDAAVLPNEAAGKVYIFPEADAMNVNAQNAFLKLLEEPPAWVMFLLCAENRDALLPTIRSRCGEVRLGGAAAEPDSGATARAEAWLAAADDRAELLRVCAGLEKLDTVQALEFVERARALAPEKLAGGEAILAAEAALGRAAQYLRGNVGVKHVMGYLATYTKDGK